MENKKENRDQIKFLHIDDEFDPKFTDLINYTLTTDKNEALPKATSLQRIGFETQGFG